MPILRTMPSIPSPPLKHVVQIKGLMSSILSEFRLSSLERMTFLTPLSFPFHISQHHPYKTLCVTKRNKPVLSWQNQKTSKNMRMPNASHAYKIYNRSMDRFPRTDIAWLQQDSAIQESSAMFAACNEGLDTAITAGDKTPHDIPAYMEICRANAKRIDQGRTFPICF